MKTRKNSRAKPPKRAQVVDLYSANARNTPPKKPKPIPRKPARKKK